MMINSKLDIYRKEWLEVVFVGRNQLYGAFELRKFASKATNWSLVVMLATVVLLLGIHAMYQRYFKEEAPFVTYQETAVDLGTIEEPVKKENLPEEEDPIPIHEHKPQQIAVDLPKEDLIRFVEPIIAAHALITEEVATQDELNKNTKMTAKISLKASVNGTAIARGAFGSKKQDGGITGVRIGHTDGDAESIFDFRSIEIQPLPEGGLSAFMKWVGANYQYPDAALQQGVQGVVEVSFVVETDGTLTDISVKRDISYGTGEAAMNLLRKAKKWKPGLQNGRPVRVAYTLPIRLSTIQE